MRAGCGCAAGLLMAFVMCGCIAVSQHEAARETRGLLFDVLRRFVWWCLTGQ